MKKKAGWIQSPTICRREVNIAVVSGGAAVSRVRSMV